MEKIENEQLKKEILNKTYYDNYLLKLEEKDNKHFKEIMKSYIVLRTDDSLYVILNIDKPSIDKDLWFDDEEPIPKKTEELFVKYNLQMNGSKFTRYNEDIEKGYLYNPYKGSKKGLASILCRYRAENQDNFTYYRDLKEDEKTFINSIVTILLDEYIERLKKYYKRYNDKIYCRGYWVNR